MLRYYLHNGGRDIQARFQMRDFCVLRVEKQAIGHSPPFSHSLPRNICNILGFNLQGTVLPSSEVYKVAGIDNITQYPLELVPVLPPSSPTTTFPFIQNCNKNGETTPK